MIIYKKVSNPDEIEDIYRFRWRVTTEDLPESIPHLPSALISDEYDVYSVHVGARHFDLIPIGALRLVLDNPIGFPCEKSCGVTVADRKTSGEISQLAMSNVAMSILGGQREDILVGLVKVLMLQARQMGLTRCYMVLPDRLHLLLCEHGIPLHPVADACSNADGFPYVIELEQLEALLFEEHGLHHDFRLSMPAKCPVVQKRNNPRIAHLY